MAMRVETGTGAATAATMPSHEADLRLKLQTAMLRKTLDAQKSQAAELLKVLEGKGQVLDIRV